MRKEVEPKKKSGASSSDSSWGDASPAKTAVNNQSASGNLAQPPLLSASPKADGNKSATEVTSSTMHKPVETLSTTPVPHVSQANAGSLSLI